MFNKPPCRINLNYDNYLIIEESVGQRDVVRHLHGKVTPLPLLTLYTSGSPCRSLRRFGQRTARDQKLGDQCYPLRTRKVGFCKFLLFRTLTFSIYLSTIRLEQRGHVNKEIFDTSLVLLLASRRVFTARSFWTFSHATTVLHRGFGDPVPSYSGAVVPVHYGRNGNPRRRS